MTKSLKYEIILSLSFLSVALLLSSPSSLFPSPSRRGLYSAPCRSYLATGDAVHSTVVTVWYQAVDPRRRRAAKFFSRLVPSKSKATVEDHLRVQSA